MSRPGGPPFGQQQQQQPLSFKTVPGRNRTQKWQQAKTYNYDGDDWGGYDPYDEYAGLGPESSAFPDASQPAPSHMTRTSSFNQGDERRNFSAGPVLYEDESLQSNTSSAVGHSQSRPRDFTNPEQVPPPLNTRASPSPSPFPPRKSSVTRDAAPTGLTSSSIQSETTGSHTVFPPRKSSIKRDAAPVFAQSASSSDVATSSDAGKPLPFIRPSDIYKRVAEEREKERLSLDSNRPSMDSIRKDVAPPPTHQDLDTVEENLEPETPSNATFPSTVAARSKNTASDTPTPVLPEVTRISTFGSDFFSSASHEDTKVESKEMQTIVENPLQSHKAESAQQKIDEATSPSDFAADLQHQPSVGLRSVVHTAFDRKIDSSVPATPLSRDGSQSTVDGPGVSRSDTNSTSSISPIMSHVPSSKQLDTSARVPPIAEEPLPATTFNMHSTAPKNVPGDSRPTSGDIPIAVTGFQQGYRRSMDPPSKENSPARTPHVEDRSQGRLSGPFVASYEASAFPDFEPDIATTGLKTIGSGNSRLSDTVDEYTKALPVASRGRSGTNYSLREADLANAVSESPENAAVQPAIAHAEAASREQFLREHNDLSPPVHTNQKSDSRSGSPSKGRVREIAGQLQETHNASRRGSETSARSRKSSWSNFNGSQEDISTIGKQTDGDKDRESLNPTGVSKALPAPANTLSATRSGVESQQSFRPQIPGGWESAGATPASEDPPVLAAAEPQSHTKSTSDQEIDLAPTTKRISLQGTGSQGPTSALRTAGAALGVSLLGATAGSNQAHDFASTKHPTRTELSEPHLMPSTGAIITQLQPPLLGGQSEISDAPTSVASSLPPTPPSKDAPVLSGQISPQQQGNAYRIGDIPPTVPLKVGTERHRGIDGTTDPGSARLTSNDPVDDIGSNSPNLESDRLHREIEQSLNDSNPAPTSYNTETTGRPHLPQRFSWEEPLDMQPVSTLPAPTPNAPLNLNSTPLPDLLPTKPYERPASKDLHVMNDDVVSPISTGGEMPMLRDVQVSPESTPAAGDAPSGTAAVSAIDESADASRARTFSEILSPPPPIEHGTAEQPAKTPEAVFTTDSASSSPVGNSKLAAALGFSSPSKPEPELPRTPENKPKARRNSIGKRIPPFREILAVKSSTERIRIYDRTRHTFAEMDTGLNVWLAKMAEQHPDVAQSAATPHRMALQSVGTNTFGKHKHSPSLMKFTNQFSGSGERKTSLSGGAGGSDRPDMGQLHGNTPGGDGEGRRMNVDMDKMQQRGKDLIKNANILGGKAQAGAKGLFAKGKSRFGGKKESRNKRQKDAASLTPATRGSTTWRPEHDYGESGEMKREIGLVVGDVQVDDRSVPRNQATPSNHDVLPVPAPVSIHKLDAAHAAQSSHAYVHVHVDDEDREDAIARPSTTLTRTSRGELEKTSSTVQVATLSVPSNPTALHPMSVSPPYPSVPSRSQTHTPSSLSRSLSKRLSRLSRSISRSSRSTSRPVSLIRTPQEPALDVEGASHPTAISIPDSSEVAIAPGLTTGDRNPVQGQDRREVWDQGKEFLTPKLQPVVSIPDRLGVLPSPSGRSVFSRTFHDQYDSNENERPDSDRTPTQPPKLSLSMLPSQRRRSSLGSKPPVSPLLAENHQLQRGVDSTVEAPPLPGVNVENDAFETATNISADDNFVDASDRLEDGPVAATCSRRTSVSSLDSPATAIGHTIDQPTVAAATETLGVSINVQNQGNGSPTMLGQDEQVPTSTDDSIGGEIAAIASQPQSDEQNNRFMNRPYSNPLASSKARPLSYVTAPRDSRGVPTEQISTSANGGMFEQQDVSPIEITNENISNPAWRGTGSAGFPRAYSRENVSRTSQTATHRATVSDLYGLEDLPTTGPEALKGTDDQSIDDSYDGRDRRSSRLWQKLTRSTSKRSGSRHSSVLVLEGQNKGSNLQSNKLQKRQQPIQRSATTSTVPVTVTPSAEPANKRNSRFSKIGSFFGRSKSIKAQDSSAPNKLTKRPQMASGQSREKMESFDGIPNQNGYERFGYDSDALGSKEQRRMSAIPIGSRPRGSSEHRRTRSYEKRRSFPPPMDGSEPPVPPLPKAYGQQPSQSSYSKIPQAFRPTEMSYGQDFEPIGPPIDATNPVGPPPLSQQPTLPTDHPSWLQDTKDSSREEQIIRQAPKSTRPTIAIAAGDRGERQASEEDVVARSPARNYPEQQTPWAITLPAGMSHPSSREVSWSHGPIDQGDSYTRTETQTQTVGNYQHQSFGPAQNYTNTSTSSVHYGPTTTTTTTTTTTIMTQPNGHNPSQVQGRGNGNGNGNGNGSGSGEALDEPITMSATTYPGQEWIPSGMARNSWD